MFSNRPWLREQQHNIPKPFLQQIGQKLQCRTASGRDQPAPESSSDLTVYVPAAHADGFQICNCGHFAM